MTIVVNVEELPLEQVTKQLNKLVNVLKIVELDPDAVGAARAAAGQGRAPTATTAVAGARDRRSCSAPRSSTSPPTRVTIEATGSRDKLEALLRVLEPFGIKELVQSGMVAVGRGPRSITDRACVRRPIA